VPRTAIERFSTAGSHLERYASVLPCVEINSSFYRPHRHTTYARWAASTPPAFRFALKVPKTITHELGLRRARAPLEQFLAETAGLGGKRGVLLVQLPPSFAFDRRVAERFFDLLRDRYDGSAACEPRHATWMTADADALLARHRIARVAADPPQAVVDGRPAGWPGLVYFRLHGSPRTYWSRYSPEYIRALGDTLSSASRDAETWCVFDNTASGAAMDNACELSDALVAAERCAVGHSANHALQ
jgi:uncharacterized protein YecE (DUF72 family)